MTIQQAIEKAVEGGYHRGQIGTSPIVEINCDFAITETKGERNHYGLAWVWLDPLFWQSLVTAMEWDRDLEGLKCSCSEDIYYSYQFCPKCGKQMRKVEVMTTYWKKEWHRFVDALAEGKSAEDFFKEL